LKSSSSRTFDALKSRNISCFNVWETISTQRAEKIKKDITIYKPQLTEYYSRENF
jgi:hypothetical protein